jgi:hypothetical protein
MTILRVVTLGTLDFSGQHDNIDTKETTPLQFLSAQVGMINAPNADIIVDQQSTVKKIKSARAVFEFIPEGSYFSKINNVEDVAQKVIYIVDNDCTDVFFLPGESDKNDIRFNKGKRTIFHL